MNETTINVIYIICLIPVGVIGLLILYAFLSHLYDMLPANKRKREKRKQQRLELCDKIYEISSEIYKKYDSLPTWLQRRFDSVNELDTDEFKLAAMKDIRECAIEEIECAKAKNKQFMDNIYKLFNDIVNSIPEEHSLNNTSIKDLSPRDILFIFKRYVEEKTKTDSKAN